MGGFFVTPLLLGWSGLGGSVHMEFFVAVGVVHGGFENAWSRPNLLQYARSTGELALGERRGVGCITRALCERISALTW